MDFVTGSCETKDMEFSDFIQAEDNSIVKTHGMIYSIKDMGDFGFLTLRKRDGLVQCVFDKGKLEDLGVEMSVNVEGTLKKEERAPGGFEIHLLKAEVLTKPKEAPAINLSKRKLGMSLETNIAQRPITLRNNRERAIFKIQEGVIRGFREYFMKHGFTEINTPKIVASGAEGGANIFKLDYFGKNDVLLPTA